MNFKILIVDDDASIHDVIKNALHEKAFMESKEIKTIQKDLLDINTNMLQTETINYLCDSAYLEEEAVEKVNIAFTRDEPYSLIIIDSGLQQGIDGSDSIDKILNKCNNVGRIILTKYPDLNWDDLKRQNKYHDQFIYLKKPFDIDVLRQIVLMFASASIKAGNLKTQIKFLEENLELRTRELNNTVEDYLQVEQKREQALNAKHQFVSIISHELRTPLTAAISIMKAFERTNLDSEQKSYLKIVNETHEILLNIIDNILDFSRLENNKLELYEILFDYKKLVKMNIKHMEEMANENGNTININIDSNIPDQLYGDPGKIRQIYTNILGNAVKFTNNGTIDVILELLNESSDNVTILTSIMDTGIGIDASQFEKIFTYFSQGDSGIHRKYGGTGIGLNVSKKLIERMGGKIGVVSKAGEGANFTFHIVLKKNEN